MEGKSIVPPAGGLPARTGDSGAASAGPAPVQGLVYDGRLWGLYKIFLVNLLLGIVTLGIYRFWGKTRIRRYLWSHTAYDGDRLEYSGKGGELFIGFLVVVGILIAFTAINTGMQYALPIYVPDLQAAAIISMGSTLLFYVVLFFLIFLGQYTALRYRLTRTSWRGIRGGLDGSAWRYARMAMGYAVLKVLTLGQFTPFAAVRQWSYRIGNVYFGTARASFAGSGRAIYKPFLLSFIATLLTVMIAYGGALALSPKVRDMMRHATATIVEDVSAEVGDRMLSRKQAGTGGDSAGGTTETWSEGRRQHHMTPQLVPAAPDGADAHMEIFRFIGIIFLIAVPVSLVAAIAHCWYWVRLLMLMAHGTTIAGLRFRTTASTGRLWWLVAGNTLIYLLTLGLGLPILLHRIWRFVANNLVIDGTIDGALIAQSQLAAPTRGEGLLEALDPGIF